MIHLTYRLKKPLYSISLEASTYGLSAARRLKMASNGCRAMTTNPSTIILLGSVRVLKNYIATLTHNLWASSPRIRHLLKLFLGL
jgi:hypothetical protein